MALTWHVALVWPSYGVDPSYGASKLIWHVVRSSHRPPTPHTAPSPPRPTAQAAHKVRERPSGWMGYVTKAGVTDQLWLIRRGARLHRAAGTFP